MAHTKVEWKVSKPKGTDEIIAIHPPHFYFHGKVNKQTLADAQLIASAPDMYQILKLILENEEARNDVNDWGQLMLDTQQAINKAEGN